MKYRLLGKTGVAVSELCLGTMTFGGRGGMWKAIGELGQKEVDGLIGAALDAGVNFIDTADVYSEGESERLTGQALRDLDRPRDQVVVATKALGRMGPGPNQAGLSRLHILHAIDASLKRLQLDHIDLYQVHGIDKLTPIEETMEALDQVVRAGKVRYIGYCNEPAWVSMKANAYAERHGLTKFVSAQMYYSIAGRDLEREVAPFCQSEGLAILPWSPLAGGLLSGKFDLEGEHKPEGPGDARRAKFDFPPVDRERARVVVRAMREVSKATDVSVARIALAWLLSRPYVTSVIIGAKNRQQLDDNLAASDVKLTPEQLAKLDAASALPSEYPALMVERQSGESRLDVKK
jgi:aryl-alcohol dehydrogenase-like predicted oxidoreductase